MQNEGSRRQGRFIKHSSKILEKVSLVDFSFREISDVKVVTPDNAKRTIIHTNYHDPDEIQDTVHQPNKFNDSLISRDQERSVIFPMDFTKEWERDKKLRKDRVTRQDDEDFDLDFDANALHEELELDPETNQAEMADAAAEPAPATPPETALESEAAAAQAGAENSHEARPESATGAAPQWESMNVVGQAIKGLMHSDTPPPPPSSPEVADEFIPVTTNPVAQDEPTDPEAQAAHDYQRRVEAQIAQDQQIEAAIEEAKAQGYRDGFRMGEEKAELQARQNAMALFGKVSELIQEFGHLKQEVLNNVQENFYELAQAIAEALIKREFSIHPETFVTVLRRAIDEAVEPGSFKIKVNPETYERIANLGTSDILAAMSRDKDVEPGDFKIESQLSVVDVSIRKMIADLLQQADLNLFQEEEKAG